MSLALSPGGPTHCALPLPCHNGPAAGAPAVGIGVLNIEGGHTASQRFFCVRNMASPLWAGRVGVPSGTPAPSTGTPILHGSAHPDWRQGWREKSASKESLPWPSVIPSPVVRPFHPIAFAPTGIAAWRWPACARIAAWPSALLAIVPTLKRLAPWNPWGCVMANLPILSALPAHTPGPWSVENLRTRLAINSSRMMVAYLPFTDATCQSDAALIAAAPDLLEALLGMVEVFGDEYGGSLETITAARAAIAKASGVLHG